ncbi:hypothetical protein MCEMIEM12_02671 [Burkholderiaceae bacterium]
MMVISFSCSVIKIMPMFSACSLPCQIRFCTPSMKTAKINLERLTSSLATSRSLSKSANVTIRSSVTVPL